MQWGQIKTLFILSFLILDIYLFVQFLDKQDQEDVGVLEHDYSTIEQRLEDEDITIPSLPEEEANEPFISVSQKIFTDDEIRLLNNYPNQEVAFVNNVVISVFKKPVKIPENETDEGIESIVKGSIIFPDEYKFWDWNKEMNVLILFQEKIGRPVYFNQNGVILVFLNDDNEMVFYTQTVLGDAKEREDKKKLITPIKAIETLYNANELSSGDKVTEIDIGFHTRVPLANGVQVFVPAWKVSVNDNKNYFVNAIEGWIFSSNEVNFLTESIKHDIERVQSMTDNEHFKLRVLSLLKDRLDSVNLGGEE